MNDLFKNLKYILIIFFQFFLMEFSTTFKSQIIFLSFKKRPDKWFIFEFEGIIIKFIRIYITKFTYSQNCKWKRKGEENQEKFLDTLNKATATNIEKV